MSDPDAVHPCLRCGACCSAFRVAFHWMELEHLGVPESLTRRLDSHRLELLRAADERCEALAGTVGAAVRCQIYEQRPSPCRELQAAYENGQPSPQCDRARERHGLPPLTAGDWNRAQVAD